MKVTTDACLFGAWVARTLAGENALGNNDSSGGQQKFLDVGTGSGLLALMVAQKTNALIDAIEIDEAAAQQAADNCRASPYSDRLAVLHNDLLQWKPAGRYDVIFSNPPFYQKDLRSASSAKNKAHHDEGLRLAELVSFIEAHLADEGRFFLLLPVKREAEAELLLLNAGLFLQKKRRVQQTSQHPPFRVMLQGGKKKAQTVPVQQVIIKNENGQYTPDFVALLHPYYLHL